MKDCNTKKHNMDFKKYKSIVTVIDKDTNKIEKFDNEKIENFGNVNSSSKNNVLVVFLLIFFLSTVILLYIQFKK